MKLINIERKFEKEEEYANFKYKLATIGVVPIYDMDKLFIYKIQPTEELKDLCNDYKENLSEIYKVVFARPTYDPCYYQGYLKSFGDMLGLETPTDKELYEKFGFNDEHKKETYLKNNAKYVKRQVVRNNIIDEEYGIETFDEVITRLKRDYATFTFRRNSKLASITSLIEKDYFSLEVMANAVYELLYGKKISINSTSIYIDISNIVSMPYSNKEKKLLVSDKIMIIKDIISKLNIECIYSGAIANMPYIGLTENIKDVKTNINRLAQENSELLFSSEFKDTYNKIKSSKIKIL